MFAVGMDLTILVPVAAFGAFAGIAWLVVDALAGKKSAAEMRLDELSDRGKASQGGLNRVSNAVSNWLDKATPKLAKPLQPRDAHEANKLALRLSYAGFRSEKATYVFLTLKLLCVLGGAFLLGGGFLLTEGLTQPAVLKSVAGIAVMLFVPDVILYFLASRRKKALFLALPDAIDLMVVCVEAGLGLDQTMRKVAKELKKAHAIIADEFGIANMQMQMGIPRIQVLRDLGARNGEDDLRGFAAVLVQASKFGSGVGQALRIHSDSMRTRRRQLAEEQAAKTAVKLIFPLVLFIFPAVFVVLVGPAAINIMRNLFPMMSGS